MVGWMEGEVEILRDGGDGLEVRGCEGGEGCERYMYEVEDFEVNVVVEKVNFVGGIL
jgi:hypothetical protein